jgi:hypothetical protein
MAEEQTFLGASLVTSSWPNIALLNKPFNFSFRDTGEI